MNKTLTLIAIMAASPALAASKNPFSADFYKLSNTDFIVAVAFFLFIGVLFYFKVPTLLGGLLDKRAEGIKSELDEARALREEAQSVLASYERDHDSMFSQRDRIYTAGSVFADQTDFCETGTNEGDNTDPANDSPGCIELDGLPTEEE